MNVTEPARVSDIESGLRALVSPGSIFEVRALKVQRNGNGYAATWSGYFDNPDAAARGIADLDGAARGVYVTLNPTKPELLARAANRVREVRKDDATTTDADILRRTRLLVDVDPVRPTGISATEAEHRLARERTEAIRAELERMGAPDPLLVDTGNGSALVYAIDLPADDGGLVRRVLAGLAFRFDDDAVKVDTGNYNPARIFKVAGTLARKGDDTPERPHRRAALLSRPFDLAPVPPAILEAVAAWAPAPEKPTRTSSTRSGDALDLAAWLERHGIEGRRPRTWQGGVIYDIPCPVAPEHGFDAWAGQDGTGKLSAACFHATCSLKTWRDLRDRYEPRPTRGTRPPGDAPEEPAYLRDEDDARAEMAQGIIESLRSYAANAEPETDLEAPEGPELAPAYAGPILPASCWRPGFTEYRDAYAGTTEATDAFAWGGFLCAAGLMLGRNARLRCGVRVFPNTYGVNCGETGISRKSTSRDNASENARAADESILAIPAVGSPEGLLEAMEDGKDSEGPSHRKRVLLDVDELSMLTLKASSETTRSLGPMLTRLYDCPDEYALPKAGHKRRIVEPFLSILTSTTIEWLQRDMTEALLRGGLGNRFLYYVGPEKAPIAFPDYPDERALGAARERLTEARDRHGIAREYALTPEAKAVYETWYAASRARMEDSPHLAILSHRLHTNLWRVVLVFAALEDTGAVTADQMTAGVEFAEYQRAAHRFVFEGYGDSARAKIEGRIRKAFQTHGEMKAYKLRERVRHVEAEELDRCLRALVRLGEVSCRSHAGFLTYSLVGGRKRR